LPVEVFKVTNNADQLHAADFDGDGRKDLVIVNNDDSRIEILHQRATPEEAKKEDEKRDVNELSDSWRFSKKRIPVDRNIQTLTVGDFDGDGKPDLAYIGENELIVRTRDAQGEWDALHKVRISDGLNAFQWRFAVADVNRDGKDDAVILAGPETLICLGDAKHPLEKFERLKNTSDGFGFHWVKDFDGDGRADLVFLAGDDPQQSLVVRFQDAQGRFGPENRLKLPAPRAFDLADLDHQAGAEMLTVDRNTGRARMFRLAPPASREENPTSPLVQFGIGSGGSGRNRLLATGDVNGDGLLDVVVADGDAALMTVFLQEAKSGLGAGVSFPGLTGIRGLAMADLDGDKKAEILIASEREKVIALTRWKENRLTFPETLPSSDSPMALALVDFNGNGRLDVAYVASKKRGEYVLRKLTLDAEEGWQAGEFGGEAEIALSELRSPPGEMIALDADKDGRDDLLILSPSAPALFLLTDAHGVPHPSKAASQDRLGNIAPGQVTIGQLDGPAVIVSQKTFARRVGLDAKTQWSVLDQYNTTNANASIVGTAIIDVDGDGQAEICLVDAGAKRLKFLKKIDGVYREWKDQEIGFFAYQSNVVGDFNSDGRQDLLLFSPEKFGIIYTGSAGPTLDEFASFESKLKDVQLEDLIAGDLGGGPEIDLMLIDAKKNRVQIITPRDDVWQSALSFVVFETPTREFGGGRPREMVVADVTGDGLDDLIFLIHDRILLYPQDAGDDAPQDGDKKPKAKN
ncbi:MAG TPA: VCBS repeat-containing protein, partial [Pirellulales bacterium]